MHRGLVGRLCVAKTTPNGKETRLPFRRTVLNQWGRFAPTAVGETFPHFHNLPLGSRDLLLQGFSENALLGEGSWEQIKCRMVSPKRDSLGSDTPRIPMVETAKARQPRLGNTWCNFMSGTKSAQERLLFAPTPCTQVRSEQITCMIERALRMSPPERN